MSETETTGAGGPEAGELPLSFEAWAELSARLLNREQGEQLDILDERKVKFEDWQRCDKHYALTLADDVRHGRMQRVEGYGSTCAAEMARRRKGHDASATAAALPQASEQQSADPVPAAPQPETTVPSFLQRREGAVAAPFVPPLAVQRPAEQLAGTAMAFELPSALRRKPADALPFQAGASPSLASTPGEARPARDHAPYAGQTLGVGVDLLALAKQSLPFSKGVVGPAPVAYPRMPLETYASFCAELAVAPEKAAETLSKYNVTNAAAHAALDQDWRTRFDAHADTKVEWERLCASYRDWLLSRPR
jgi:hypothetical protein